MKVSELIAELQKQDPDAEVLGGDNDDWFYDLEYVDTGYVLDGRVVNPQEEPEAVSCVLIRT
jgi:hypothetical protein